MIAGNPEESPDFMGKAPGNSWGRESTESAAENIPP